MRKNKAKFKADGIAFWTWLHENPLKTKNDLPDELFKIATKYTHRCPFCEYYKEEIVPCSGCPLGDCDVTSWYWKWENAKTKKQSQKYSGLILKAFQEW